MDWSADGLLIGIRRHGETSVIAEAMVVGHGRTLGLVRGGRSRKLSAILQPGNTLQLTWRARLEDHLGMFSVEPLVLRAAPLMADRNRLYLAQLLFDHLRLLPERDPNDRLLGMGLKLLDARLDTRELIAFELALLEELGFGLDLDSCAATGQAEDLAFVSPRSGRAVSLRAGEPYRDKLLELPPFLVTAINDISARQIQQAFALTGFFLNIHIWQPRRLNAPPTREPLIAALTSAESNPTDGVYQLY